MRSRRTCSNLSNQRGAARGPIPWALWRNAPNEAKARHYEGVACYCQPACLLPKYLVFPGRQLLYPSAVVVSSARAYPFRIYRFCCGFSAASWVGNLYVNAARPMQKQVAQLYALEPVKTFPEPEGHPKTVARAGSRSSQRLISCRH